jgi:nucleoside-diphosphate-sugar epimerase
MKTVFLTGAAGFIGGHTAREFAARGFRVLALVHRTGSATLDELAGRGRARIVRGDAADFDGLHAALAGERLAAIVHAAGRASDVGRPVRFRRANLDSTVAMVRLTKALGVPRFVFVSTTDVYGLRDFAGETEDELPLRANVHHPYPETKIAAERHIRRHLPRKRYAIVRPATVWGPGDPTFAPRIVSFLRRSPVMIHFGRWRGRNRWPLAHVSTVARALVSAATDPAAAGRARNVLDPERTTADEFYRRVAAEHLPGKRYRSITLPFWLGEALGLGVSFVSDLLDLDHPFMDPTRYGLHLANRNLDFGTLAGSNSGHVVRNPRTVHGDRVAAQ